MRNMPLSPILFNSLITQIIFKINQFNNTEKRLIPGAIITISRFVEPACMQGIDIFIKFHAMNFS